MKKIKTKIILSLIAILILLPSLSPIALGLSYRIDEDPDTTCNPEAVIYEQGERWWDVDIRRLVNNLITSIFVTIYAQVVGVNLVEAVGCEGYIKDNYKVDFLPEGVEPCRSTPDFDCEVLLNNIKVGKISVKDGGKLVKTPTYRSVRGSLLGLAYSVENFNRYEPMVFNLAYFWNRSIAKVPFVNKALAAPAPAQSYNMPMLDAAFSLWVLVRNISLGLISIILLYTGILIIMRKKVNPQLVVNVQYAIPKVIVGLLLIIFSYPIGAALIAISWGVFRGAASIVFDAAMGGLFTDKPGTGLGAGAVFIAITLAQIRYGIGLTVLLMVIFTSMLCAILWIAVQVKAAFIYFKMVLAVVTSPLEMAIGTVPGSEAKIGEWFKRMAKLGVSVMALGFSIPVVVILAFTITVAYASSAETTGMGNILRVLVPLGVVIYGFILALNIDKTVAKFFGDEKTKK